MSAEETAREDPLLQALEGTAAVEEAPPRGPVRQLRIPMDELATSTRRLIDVGGHFAGVFRSESEDSLRALLALRGELIVLRTPLDGARSYPSLSRVTPAARLPERELHDVSGVVPLDHPQLDPALRPSADELERVVTGPETFVLPYGPIRSGVFEAIQFPIDTGGEDILAFTVRPYFKRRNLEARFQGLDFDHGTYLAERIAGTESVAQAIAFAQAVERVAGIEAPRLAQRWRVVHAELERIANHLDVGIKLAEDAALSVGVARLGVLKEQVMRLRARLCGNRFGRGVLMPGGVRREPLLSSAEVIQAIDSFEDDLRRDRSLLLATASFTDRLIGSGRLDAETVMRYGGVGPIARACSLGIDARLERPYGSYGRLGFRIARTTGGDAMARFEVRLEEIDQSVHVIRQALERLDGDMAALRIAITDASGEGCGWAEAPNGEVIYWIAIEDGRLREVHIVSPSLRNWPLLSESYRGDVLTDVSFIEHSFGLTPAGADR
ncbi:MAG TPA: NADH-quinone oxidoreductase subunit C [Gaiellaceae bacterium]|nr:NADH-quinone oxidoreductase subunit C [Gaiellaceae bacterium]